MSEVLTWIIFVIIVLSLAAFCFALVKYYADPKETSKFIDFSAAGALFVTLLCVLLIPIDIYVISSNTDPDTGLQRDPEGLQSLTTTIRHIYYVFYSLQLFFSFFLLPFAYFFYEEAAAEDITIREKIFNALKYTLIFTLVAVVLIVIGNFINTGQVDSQDSVLSKITSSLNSGDVILTFTIACLTLFGLVGFVTYTAFGMAYLPISLFRSIPTASTEMPTNVDFEIRKTKEAREYLEYGSRTRKLSNREMKELRTLQTEEKRLEKLKNKQDEPVAMSTKLWNYSQPFRIIAGICCLGISFLFVISLLLSLIDQTMNSTCGVSCGWILNEKTIFNPFNELLQIANQVFPVDYLVFGGMVLYAFVCTLIGLGAIGVRILCWKLYNMRKRRSVPNGMLMGIWMCTLVVLALNIQMLNIAPEYTQFGNQKFIDMESEQMNLVGCTLDANETEEMLEGAPDQCVLSQVYQLMGFIIAGMPFFGVVLFVANWAFIGAFFLSLLVSAICIKPTSDAYGPLGEEEDRLESVFD